MGIVLSHQTALRALRTWDFIPHGRRSPLCPNLSCGRSAARDNATCFPIERPTAKQVSALRHVPSPFPASEEGSHSLLDGPPRARTPPAQPNEGRLVPCVDLPASADPIARNPAGAAMRRAGIVLCAAGLGTRPRRTGPARQRAARNLDAVSAISLRHRRATCADRRRPDARGPRPNRGASGRRAGAPVP